MLRSALVACCQLRHIRCRKATSVASFMRSLLPSNYQAIVDDEKKLLIELHQTLHDIVRSHLLIDLLTHLSTCVGS